MEMPTREELHRLIDSLPDCKKEKGEEYVRSNLRAKTPMDASDELIQAPPAVCHSGYSLFSKGLEISNSAPSPS